MTGSTFVPAPLGSKPDGRILSKDSRALDDLAARRFDALPPGAFPNGYRALLLFERIRCLHLRWSAAYQTLSVSKIGHATGMTNREVSRFLGQLSQAGLITWERPKATSNQWKQQIGVVSLLTPEELMLFRAAEGVSPTTRAEESDRVSHDTPSESARVTSDTLGRVAHDTQSKGRTTFGSSDIEGNGNGTVGAEHLPVPPNTTSSPKVAQPSATIEERPESPAAYLERMAATAAGNGAHP